jgi:hypothetical protein
MPSGSEGWALPPSATACRKADVELARLCRERPPTHQWGARGQHSAVTPRGEVRPLPNPPAHPPPGGCWVAQRGTGGDRTPLLDPQRISRDSGTGSAVTHRQDPRAGPVRHSPGAALAPNPGVRSTWHVETDTSRARPQAACTTRQHPPATVGRGPRRGSPSVCSTPRAAIAAGQARPRAASAGLLHENA